MKRKVFIFLVRLVNIPGAVFALFAYEFTMYRRQQQNKEVALYSLYLRNVLTWAIPWISATIWAAVLIGYWLKTIFV